MVKTKDASVENLKADIVIIGGGGAGLPAAVTAAEAGVKNIIVLEKAHSPGGNAVLAGGMFAVESPAQKRLGVGLDYTRDQAFLDKMNLSNWTIDPRVVRTLVNTTGELVGWLESKGLQFNYVYDFGSEGEYKYPDTHHMFSQGHSGRIGKKVMVTLAAECQRLGVQIITDAAAKHILTDKNGKVTGVTAVKDGEEIKIAAKAVVITAGGFAGNKQLMDKYLPAKGVRVSLSLPLTGDGLIMAEEVGAVIDDIITQFFIGPHHYPYAHSLNPLLRRPEAIWVNKRGVRFSDESLFLGRQQASGNPLNRQPDEVCYGLIDSGILQYAIEKLATTQFALTQKAVNEDFEIDIKKGVAKIADTWDEIAAFIGAKPEVLKATVEQYNAYCDKGYDYDMLKEKKYLLPLRKPPFYAILGRQGYDSTFGGIKINERMEVIDKKFDVITGLYAAGNNAGSFIATIYHPKHAGTSLGFAMSSGYLAGKSAAQFVLGKKK